MVISYTESKKDKVITMKFKAKLFKLGNSKGIYLKKEVYTNLEEGKEYEWEVYTEGKEKETITPKVYTPVLERKVFNAKWCEKHNVYKGNCKCK